MDEICRTAASELTAGFVLCCLAPIVERHADGEQRASQADQLIAIGIGDVGAATSSDVEQGAL